jgi:type I restriction enzyme R subunit
VKTLESELLQQQALNNSKQQFHSSPDIMPQLLNAIIESYDAHEKMGTKALNSEEVRRGIVEIMLNHLNLWEELKRRAG